MSTSESESSGPSPLRFGEGAGGRGAFSPTEARARLAEQQAALVRALTGRGAIPSGFAEDRLRMAARSLAGKRRQEVARAWPALTHGLRERFARFAEATPLPAEGGPLADGRAFARTLTATEWTDEMRLAVLAVDLRWRRCDAGLVPRRGVALKGTWLPLARRLIVGVRLPWLGVSVWSVPLGRGARVAEG